MLDILKRGGWNVENQSWYPAKPVPGPLLPLQESDKFDTVCLATAAHKLASLRGAPNLHAQIVQAPEFYKLKQLIGTY